MTARSDQYLIDHIRSVCDSVKAKRPIREGAPDCHDPRYYPYVVGTLCLLSEQAADRIEQMKMEK